MKKTRLTNFPLWLSLSAGCAVISLILTAVLLGWMTRLPGEKNAVQVSVSTAAGERFRMDVNNRISDALDGVASIKKVYWISDNTSPGPKPNPDNYGSVKTPQKMQSVLEQAQDVLDGQKLFFSTDREIMKDSKVRYYLDDTIFAVAWKEVKNDSVLTFAEVKIVHPSQFRRFLSGDEFGSGKLYLTTEMSKTVNAVVAGNGDYYAYRSQGVTITDGVVHRNNAGIPDICYVKSNGDMMLVHGKGFSGMAKAQSFADENDVIFSLSFGPILVQDGKKASIRGYPMGEVDQYYTRAAICQMDRLHYLFVAVNAEEQYSHLPEINEFASWIYETGCRQAYTLDGGQTATVVMNNKLVNHVNYGSQRRISDIIYFATAMPGGG